MTPETPIVLFEITDYMVAFRQLELRSFAGVEARIRGLIRCSGHTTSGESYRLDVYFLASDSPFPMPMLDWPNKSGAIFLPMSEMSTVIDVLRYEKPIYGHLRGDRPEWTGLTTGQEPVGEGQEG